MEQALLDLIKTHTKAVEDKLAEVDKKVDINESILGSLEQKMARTDYYGGRGDEPQTWGKQFAGAEGLKSFADDRSRPSRFRVDVKSITSGNADGFLQPNVVEPAISPRRTVKVRDLLPVVRIDSASVEYAKQTTRTNAADVVAEGAAKPESAYAFQLRTATARTIAHWVPASRQILDDANQLADVIDQELRYGLQLKEDAQLLYGDGTGQNLSGLVTNATAFAAPAGAPTADNMIDTIALAILQASLADFQPSGVVIHPSDWTRIRLLKNADDEYLLGPPGAAVDPRLLGLPVVVSPAMTVDKFLVGDFRAAATLFDRWEPRVEVSTEHDDFFTRNLVAILAEERIALAVKQAGALIYGDFGNVA